MFGWIRQKLLEKQFSIRYISQNEGIFDDFAIYGGQLYTFYRATYLGRWRLREGVSEPVITLLTRWREGKIVAKYPVSNLVVRNIQLSDSISGLTLVVMETGMGYKIEGWDFMNHEEQDVLFSAGVLWWKNQQEILKKKEKQARDAALREAVKKQMKIGG